MTTDFHDDPDIIPILPRLRDPDATVRRIAVLDLGDLDGDAHVPLLIGALEDSAAQVRLEAARALEAF